MTSCSLMKFLDHTKASTGASAGLLLALTHINGDEDSRRISKALDSPEEAGRHGTRGVPGAGLPLAFLSMCNLGLSEKVAHLSLYLLLLSSATPMNSLKVSKRTRERC